MGIGIVLNQLASMSTALSGISSTMSSLGSVASSIGAALGKAFNFAKDKAVSVFNDIKDLMKEGMTFWVNIFKGEWGKALGNVKTIWDATWGKLWGGLMTAGGKAFNGLKSIWKGVMGGLGTIYDATLGKVWDRLKSAAQGVFDTISGAWNTVTSVMRTVYDKTLGRIFNAIGGALRGVFNFGKSIVGGVKDLIPGGGGGSTTSVGTAVSGGVTNTFNMTFNLSGMTDRTDKRAMAREIGDLVQQELSRSSGGGRIRGRYS